MSGYPHINFRANFIQTVHNNQFSQFEQAFDRIQSTPIIFSDVGDEFLRVTTYEKTGIVKKG